MSESDKKTKMSAAKDALVAVGEIKEKLNEKGVSVSGVLSGIAKAYFTRLFLGESDKETMERLGPVTRELLVAERVVGESKEQIATIKESQKVLTGKSAEAAAMSSSTSGLEVKATENGSTQPIQQQVTQSPPIRPAPPTSRPKVVSAQGVVSGVMQSRPVSPSREAVGAVRSKYLQVEGSSFAEMVKNNSPAGRGSSR